MSSYKVPARERTKPESNSEFLASSEQCSYSQVHMWVGLELASRISVSAYPFICHLEGGNGPNRELSAVLSPLMPPSPFPRVSALSMFLSCHGLMCWIILVCCDIHWALKTHCQLLPNDILWEWLLNILSHVPPLLLFHFYAPFACKWPWDLPI